MMASKKPKYPCSFQKSFSEFPFITTSSKGNAFARCIACSFDFSISHGGKSDVTKHVGTKKHIDNVGNVESNKKLSFSVDNSDQRVINAECLFSTFLLEHNLPLSASDHAASLFKKMFPDSQIAKKYACARTKTTAIVKEMASQSKSDILNILKETPFAIATDGSNNADSKIYPIVVTFFNSVSSEIEHKLLSMPALEGDSTGFNIAQLVINKFKEDNIPMNNCLALSADNAPVMVGIKNGVSANLKKEIPSLYVMGCLCHLINIAAEKGAASLPFNVDECLVDIFYYLEKSSKRKEKLKKFQELHNTEIRKILKHVCTRWLSLGKCLTRVNDQWQPLLSFFKGEVDGSKTKFSNSTQRYKISKISESAGGNEVNKVPTMDKEKNDLPKVNESAAHSDKERIIPILNKEKQKIPKVEKNDEENKVPALDKERIIPILNKEKQKLSKVEKNDEENKVPNLDKVKTKVAFTKDKKPQASTSKENSKSGLKRKRSKSQSSQKIPKVGKKSEILTREERIFMFLSSDRNKAFCLFLQSVLPVFDVPNTILQTRMPLIHMLHSVISDLFKNVLSRFVKASLVISSKSVYEVDYRKTENQKKDEDLVVGTATSKVLKELPEKEKKTFYLHIRQYFCQVCDYILSKFPINDEVILYAKVANVSTLPEASFSDVKYFLNRFPAIIASIFMDADFDASVDVLEAQFCSLQLEDLSEIKKSERTDTQWSLVGKIKGLDGSLKYKEIANVMLGILTIPHSNAECERIFSMVNKTRNKFRSNMSDETLEKIIMAKVSLEGCCYEQHFEPAFLKKAKSATLVSNSNLSVL